MFQNIYNCEMLQLQELMLYIAFSKGMTIKLNCIITLLFNRIARPFLKNIIMLMTGASVLKTRSGSVENGYPALEFFHASEHQICA